MVKVFLLLAGLVPLTAHADLYRWIDPQSGSVKFSSYPPPWMGDPQAPAVEVIPYRGQGAPPKPAAGPATPDPGLVARLEEQLKQMWQSFATLPAGADFLRAGSGFEQQLRAYAELREQLDRIDPGGIPRRRAQEANMLPAKPPAR